MTFLLYFSSSRLNIAQVVYAMYSLDIIQLIVTVSAHEGSFTDRTGLAITYRSGFWKDETRTQVGIVPKISISG